MNSLKVSWDHERQALQTRLDVKEQEHKLAKANLEQKHSEVSNIYSHSWAKHSGLMTIKYFAVVYSASCNNLANYFKCTSDN